jgi:phosphoserine phosphatase
MTENTAQQEQFTGLILLTGTDKPGISASLFETLAPFAVHILDIEQIVINHRLILTVLIGANPAHQTAIEEDLAACASALDVDIATIFAKSALTDVPKDLVQIHISSIKLHPRTVALVTKALTDTNANIESFVRESTNPTSICMTVSGGAAELISAALENLPLEDATTTVNAL